MAEEEKLPQGFEWSYWKCKKHGNVSRRMYQPNSLSNPVIGYMPQCACSAHPSDKEVTEVTKKEFDQYRAAKRYPASKLAEKLHQALDLLPDADGEPGYFADVKVLKNELHNAAMEVTVREDDAIEVATRFIVEIRRAPT